MRTPAAIGGAAAAGARASKLSVVAMASQKVECVRAAGKKYIDEKSTPQMHQTTTTTATAFASSLLASLALSALPALAEIDADGVEVPNIFTSIFFTLAVALLGVCTLGILYLAAREVRNLPPSF
jgi:hypothetical protein